MNIGFLIVGMALVALFMWATHRALGLGPDVRLPAVVQVVLAVLALGVAFLLVERETPSWGRVVVWVVTAIVGVGLGRLLVGHADAQVQEWARTRPPSADQ